MGCARRWLTGVIAEVTGHAEQPAWQAAWTKAKALVGEMTLDEKVSVAKRVLG